MTDTTDTDTDENPIDPYSDYSLRDVVAGAVPPGKSTEYMGFHITCQGGDPPSFHVQLDGHAGGVDEFRSSDYTDVLALVDDLNSLVIRRHEYGYQPGKDGLVEWAGPIMTSNPDRKDDDNYIIVPDSPLGDALANRTTDESGSESDECDTHTTIVCGDE